jgi:hypothetical protein
VSPVELRTLEFGLMGAYGKVARPAMRPGGSEEKGRAVWKRRVALSRAPTTKRSADPLMSLSIEPVDAKNRLPGVNMSVPITGLIYHCAAQSVIGYCSGPAGSPPHRQRCLYDKGMGIPAAFSGRGVTAGVAVRHERRNPKRAIAMMRRYGWSTFG